MPKRISSKHKVAADPRLAEKLNIRFHRGYRDPFTRDQSPMATIPNGATVEKVVTADPTDMHKPGATGTVLGSIGVPDVGVAYFVEWHDMPGRAVLVQSIKVKS